MAENYHNIWAKKKKMELESKGKPEFCEPHKKETKKTREKKQSERRQCKAIKIK